MTTGNITEIQRCSFNDGPGIRTTVFLKGCNMNCAWCHNPETIRHTKDLHYYAGNCIGCYKCVYVCPCKAHKKINGEHRFFPNLCVKCGKCAAVCFAGAMEMSGTQMSVEDVMKQIVQDKPYYIDSNGGVTISGGEVTCQLEFATELAEACKAEGISVGIETNMNIPFEEMKPLLDKIDLVMCDLKIFDNDEHKKWTAVENDLIKENIKKLDELGLPYIVRTPLIPDATDSDANIKAIAEFLQDAKNMMYYELLNFNPLGGSKYKSLSRKNVFADAKPLPKARIQELKEIAEAYCTVRVE